MYLLSELLVDGSGIAYEVTAISALHRRSERKERMSMRWLKAYHLLLPLNSDGVPDSPLLILRNNVEDVGLEVPLVL